MNNFYITGLPRSRTAWIAAFMTSGDSFCHHEAFNGCKTEKEYRSKMSLDEYKFVGDSDSSIFLFPELINGPLVIIERDKDNVIGSLSKMNINIETVKELIDFQFDEMKKLSGLRIKFEDINNSLNKIWDYCIGNGFDKRRANLFKKMNIQTQDFNVDLESFIFKRIKTCQLGL